jgi:hypothetical protein
MGRLNRRGRRRHGPTFIQLHHDMLDSAAWRSLSAQDQATYLAIARLYNGRNNGSIGCSVRQIAARARINKDTACKCVERLADRELIECMVPGGFSRKTRHATEWRLTAFPCDKTGEASTRAFKRWRPDGPVAGDRQIQTAVRNQAISVRN